MNVECPACGKNDGWTELTDYVDFSGNTMVSYICTCNHIITVKEVDGK